MWCEIRLMYLTGGGVGGGGVGGCGSVRGWGCAWVCVVLGCVGGGVCGVAVTRGKEGGGWGPGWSSARQYLGP